MATVAGATDAYNAIKSSLNLVRNLIITAEIAKNAGLQLQLAELMEQLADAQVAILDSEETMRRKDAEIARLMEAFEFKGKLVRHLNAYYEMNEAGEQGIAYCPRCQDADHRAIPLIQNFGSNNDFRCPECSTTIPIQNA